MSTHRVILELDDQDFEALLAALSFSAVVSSVHREERPRPDGHSNLPGLLVAEICRGWRELAAEARLSGYQTPDVAR